MKKILFLVEGKTEVGVVSSLLQPHFGTTAYLRAIDLGGGGRWAPWRKQIQRCLGDGSSFVTTMLDYYALPEGTPGMLTRPATANAREKVEHIEAALQAYFDHPNFIPHVTLHEIETYVFVDPDALTEFVDAKKFVPSLVASQLLGIRESRGGAESVNDRRDTSPSHCLKRVWPDYQKAVNGPQILAKVGVPAIRSKCPHFHAWLTRLESLV